MIGKIKGKLIELDGNIGLIEISDGLSYEVFLTPVLISSHQLGKAIDVYTYLQIREDAQILFAFKTKQERNLFKQLISISGVGPKIAFTVISFSREDELLAAIKANDINYFSKIPGLGSKTAMKIILELTQKLKSEFQMEKMYLSEEDRTVIDALVSLGFKSAEAKKTVAKLPKNLSIEERIREALRKTTK